MVLTAFQNGIRNCTSLKSLSLGGVVPMKMWELPVKVTRHVITTISLCRGLDRIELKRSTFSKSSICPSDQSSKAMHNLVLCGVDRWERWHRGRLWKAVHFFHPCNNETKFSVFFVLTQGLSYRDVGL